MTNQRFLLGYEMLSQGGAEPDSDDSHFISPLDRLSAPELFRYRLATNVTLLISEMLTYQSTDLSQVTNHSLEALKSYLTSGPDDGEELADRLVILVSLVQNGFKGRSKKEKKLADPIQETLYTELIHYAAVKYCCDYFSGENAPICAVFSHKHLDPFLDRVTAAIDEFESLRKNPILSFREMKDWASNNIGRIQEEKDYLLKEANKLASSSSIERSVKLFNSFFEKILAERGISIDETFFIEECARLSDELEPFFDEESNKLRSQLVEQIEWTFHQFLDVIPNDLRSA